MSEENKTLTEDILGEFGFRCVWEINSHYATCKAYLIEARGVDAAQTPMFHKKDAPTYPDSVLDVADADVYLEAHMKWDGCSDIDHGYHHCCDEQGLIKHALLLRYVWQRGHQLIEHSEVAG